MCLPSDFHEIGNQNRLRSKIKYNLVKTTQRVLGGKYQDQTSNQNSGFKNLTFVHQGTRT